MNLKELGLTTARDKSKELKSSIMNEGRRNLNPAYKASS